MKRLFLAFAILPAVLLLIAAHTMDLGTYEGRYECMKVKCCPANRECNKKCAKLGDEKKLDCMNECLDPLFACIARLCRWTDEDTRRTFVGADDHCE